eukprot:gnl/TRDRNA2_/TRDRNA2_153206_c0_seq1.p1 gnl/TRDRNA2_/TRDRNA2_153206_c0~~gnl/TRDRNA2_/TRDRNA2_153206_c0_seq1.p1  ORF type:complete len:298 (+),score=49.27 gnl/TRDRNA2_/TRDRNA2_153206_c0_seq1:108-1001(+)
MFFAAVLVAFVVQVQVVEANPIVDGKLLYSRDTLSSKLVSRLLRESRGDLDGTTLGKLSHLALSRPAGAFSSSLRPSLVTAVVRPVHHRGLISQQRDCGFVGAAQRDDNMPLLPDEAQSLCRRQAFLLAAVAALQAPALAKVDEYGKEVIRLEDGYSDGTEGLQYRDLLVGNGAVPFEGDTLTVCDEVGSCGELTAGAGDLMAKATGTSEAKSVTGFTFTLGRDEVIKGWEKGLLGTEKMPPMKVGGTRSLIIPSELAYGAKGVGCTEQDEDGGEVCTIPPYAVMEFTIQLIKIQRK